MKNNLKQLVENWFHDSKDFALQNYATCYEWLSTYVRNCDQEFLGDFFTYEEIENNDVETLRKRALEWLDQNAEDSVNFEDYR